MLIVQISDYCLQPVSEKGNLINVNSLIAVCLHIPEMCVIMHECVCVCVCVKSKGQTNTSRDLGDVGQEVV